MSALPPDFAFSQASLQDHAECPRRFELRYVRRLVWPALQAEPAREHERRLERGAAFHRLVHQHQLGLDPALLEAYARDPQLARWWRDYLEHPPPDLPAQRRPELVLHAALDGHRLVARYDLVAWEASRAVIVDWKTSARRPPRAWLYERWQTRLYRFLLLEAAPALGLELTAEGVEMVYWFACEPQRPERFAYDAAEHEAVRAALRERLRAIATAAAFPRTSDRRACRFCPYRSYCDRGAVAGPLEEAPFAQVEPDAIVPFA